MVLSDSPFSGGPSFEGWVGATDPSAVSRRVGSADGVVGGSVLVPEPSTTGEKSRCSVCGTRAAVYPNGLVWPHMARDSNGNTRRPTRRCQGSMQPPAQPGIEVGPRVVLPVVVDSGYLIEVFHGRARLGYAIEHQFGFAVRLPTGWVQVDTRREARLRLSWLRPITNQL